MQFKLLAITAFAALATAQTAPQIPNCAVSCIVLPANCNNDPACICSSQTFIQGISCCIFKACSTADQQAALNFARSICTPAGVTNLPTAASCPANSTAASSGAALASSSIGSTGSASISSVISSISSALSSRGTSATAATGSISSAASSASASASSAASSAAAAATSTSRAGAEYNFVPGDMASYIAAFLGAVALV